MAVATMSKDYVDDGYAYTYDESLTGVGNGTDILIPPGARDVAVTVKASGGAKAQATVDDSATVVAGSATYIDWPPSAVTTETSSILSPASTAVRLVQTVAGTSSIKVRAQI